MGNYNIDLLMAACVTAGFGLSCLFQRLLPRNYDIIMFVGFVVVVVLSYSFLPNF